MVLAHIHATVEALRAELGITGYPSPRDAARLLGLFADRLVVCERNTILPRLLLMPPHRAVLVLPRDLAERQREAVIVEEIGHLLLDADVGAGCRWYDSGPLLAAQDARCERVAALFVGAWRLPFRLLSGAADEEVMESSCCSRGELARRRRVVAELLGHSS